MAEDLTEHPEHPSILIVEDHPALGPLIRRILIQAGFDSVEVVTTSRRAMESLRSRRVDLVIMDIMLPTGDLFDHGFEAGAEIEQRYPATRLLYISGYAPEDLIEKAPRSPFVFLQKVFKLPELLAKIREAMQPRKDR